MAALKSFLRDMSRSVIYAIVPLGVAAVLAVFVHGSTANGIAQALVVIAVWMVWFAMSYQIMSWFPRSWRIMVYRCCEGVFILAAITAMIAFDAIPGYSHLWGLSWGLTSVVISNMLHIIDPFGFRTNDSEGFNRRIDQTIERRRTAKNSL